MSNQLETASKSAPTVDFAAVKARQQATWGTGDFAVIGATLQVVSENLCEAVDLRAGAKVLDVACGHGNTAIAAARRFCETTGIDYVPTLVERARERAQAERFEIDFRVGDAEQLEFADASFDYVLSTYGVMFTPRQDVAARELLRVCKKGGRIGLANWTPQSMIGDVFRATAQLVPPPAGVPSVFNWGSDAELAKLFGTNPVRTRRTEFVFRYRSARHFLEVFRTWYGPTRRAFEALPEARRPELERALLDVLERGNRAKDGSFAGPSEYLEVVVEKR
jgi:ubiquinone/menaquinone biosynthesis C-methylase UbiE